jgi:hypothetical protein
MRGENAATDNRVTPTGENVAVRTCMLECGDGDGGGGMVVGVRVYVCGGGGGGGGGVYIRSHDALDSCHVRVCRVQVERKLVRHFAVGQLATVPKARKLLVVVVVLNDITNRPNGLLVSTLQRKVKHTTWVLCSC